MFHRVAMSLMILFIGGTGGVAIQQTQPISTPPPLIINEVPSPSGIYTAEFFGPTTEEEISQGCSYRIREVHFIWGLKTANCEYAQWLDFEGSEILLTKDLAGVVGITFVDPEPRGQGRFFIPADQYFGQHLLNDCPSSPNVDLVIAPPDIPQFMRCTYQYDRKKITLSSEQAWIGLFAPVQVQLAKMAVPSDEHQVTAIRVDYYQRTEAIVQYPVRYSPLAYAIHQEIPSTVEVSSFTPTGVINLEKYGLVLIGNNQHQDSVGLTFAGEWLDLHQVYPPQ